MGYGIKSIQLNGINHVRYFSSWKIEWYSNMLTVKWESWPLSVFS